MAAQQLGPWRDTHGLEARALFYESTGSGRPGYRTGMLSIQVYSGEDRLARSEERITFTSRDELVEVARRCALQAMKRVRQADS